LTKLTDVDNGINNKKMVLISVSFREGGINYSNYKHEAKGYYIHVQPVERETGENYTVDKSCGGSGIKMFLESGNRFSAKTLNNFKNKLNESNWIPLMEQIGINFEEYTK